MSTVSQLADRLQDLLEEARPGTVGLNAEFFNFWNRPNELYPLISEAVYMAQLLSGEPIVQTASPVTLTINQTFQDMPAGAVALTRVYCGIQIKKTSVFHLDNSIPKWQIATGPRPRFWFPFGLNQWGIYPQVTVPVDAHLSYVPLGVPNARPIADAQAIPLQQEYDDGLVQYAAATARFKEGGQVFDQVMFVYNEFITKMKQLGRFSDRKESLKFTKTSGVTSKITDVSVR